MSLLLRYDCNAVTVWTVRGEDRRRTGRSETNLHKVRTRSEAGGVTTIPEYRLS